MAARPENCHGDGAGTRRCGRVRTHDATAASRVEIPAGRLEAWAVGAVPDLALDVGALCGVLPDPRTDLLRRLRHPVADSPAGRFRSGCWRSGASHHRGEAPDPAGSGGPGGSRSGVPVDLRTDLHGE